MGTQEAQAPDAAVPGVGGGPRPLARPRLYEQLADHIADFIEAQGLAPGDRLPPERRLAKDLGVSRATLSRALVALEVRGRLEVRHGDGAVVRDPAARVALPSLDDAPLHEVVQARAATMTQIALAASAHPDSALRSALLADDGGPRSVEDVWACVLRLVDDGSFLARLDAALAERIRLLGGSPEPAAVRALAESVRRGRPDEVVEAVAAVLRG
ncbi:GntR family transcriptional regulator [Arthrobacter sp. NEB 688]|uniref:FadR/GntR family transcriptional regulator n=1 Tax=Arthrobacter sp. NEB 688 TaxID=904039 RepID=UPI00156436B5|nr:GntR family transcriptional regulator [Arthrobacter sp. NEB 688]QKE82628.1 GntR family transcriptional regulator [Arthrobacter sp. NEB 688]